ncbi:MAG: peptidase U32 family protein [Candidatus Shikimatogenerans sp. Tduv]|uniref:Peptidase U32 family protein n=1 Tax=Candidatus Shikimatogenerans sp. Tduv TaxID=3158567 RepID=A0AAU7QR29_9FLAO
MKKIKILAPINNFISLKCAIKAKTDFIYFGINHLNMRARNNINFKLKDLKKISKICKKNNIKSYLTLNTIIYNHDIKLVKKIINYSKNKINGIIASDNFVIQYAYKKKINVILSTQNNVTNIETIKFYSKYIDTVVLSRELNLKQIKEIIKMIKKYKIVNRKNKKIKIEIFCHGSLCMAVSGKCYISLYNNNSSANRGICKQNCRYEYLVKDKFNNEMSIKNKYIMSSKDLCTIPFLDKIVKTGISILKIEGRSKSPEYIYTTIKVYKKALNLIKNKKYNKKNKQKLLNKLKKVYNRGFWSGYYLGKKIGEWSKKPGNNSKYKKIYIGNIIKYYKKINVIKCIIKTFYLKINEKIIIYNKYIGILKKKIKKIKKNNINIKKVKKNDIFTIKINKKYKIKKNDKIYKIVYEKNI